MAVERHWRTRVPSATDLTTEVSCFVVPGWRASATFYMPPGRDAVEQKALRNLTVRIYPSWPPRKWEDREKVLWGESPTHLDPDPWGPGDAAEPGMEEGLITLAPPPGSLYPQVLRSVPLDEMLAVARESLSTERMIRVLDALDVQAETAIADSRLFVSAMDALHSLTPAQRLNMRIAIAYVDASRRFANPRVAVANEFGISEQKVTDRLVAARRAGYLSSPGKGRKGGDLSPMAMLIAEGLSNARAQRIDQAKGESE